MTIYDFLDRMLPLRPSTINSECEGNSCLELFSGLCFPFWTLFRFKSGFRNGLNLTVVNYGLFECTSSILRGTPPSRNLLRLKVGLPGTCSHCLWMGAWVDNALTGLQTIGITNLKFEVWYGRGMYEVLLVPLQVVIFHTMRKFLLKMVLWTEASSQWNGKGSRENVWNPRAVLLSDRSCRVESGDAWAYSLACWMKKCQGSWNVRDLEKCWRRTSYMMGRSSNLSISSSLDLLYDYTWLWFAVCLVRT